MTTQPEPAPVTAPGRSRGSRREPKDPDLDPTAERLLADLARRLLAEPADRRPRLAAELVSRRLPGVVPALVGWLVATVAEARSPGRREALADTLAAFGPRAADELVYALFRETRPGRQAALAGALGRVGPGLPPAARVRLALDLSIALGRATGPAAVDAVAAALVAVRLAGGPG